MNDLSNERLAAISDLDSPGCMTFPPSHDQCAAMARELLAYREAQGNAVGWKWRLVDMASSETSAWRICLLPFSPGGGAGFETESIPLYAAPQLPAVPEVLPCPVKLEPGLIMGKGVRTQVLIDALCRREKYYAELDAMTPEQRAEHEEGVASIKSMLAAAPKPDSDNVTDNAAQQFESLSSGSKNG